MDVLEEKREKKKAIRERNKRDFTIFQFLRQRDLEAERVEALQESMAPAPAPKQEEMVWSAKTQDIRNRLNGKKRAAATRWERFAATSDSGGRGL